MLDRGSVRGGSGKAPLESRQRRHEGSALMYDEPPQYESQGTRSLTTTGRQDNLESKG